MQSLNHELFRQGRGLLSALVGNSVKAAVPFIALVVLLTAGLLYYAATHLSINTDTADMLDPNLPFRQAGREFSKAFPQLSDELVVVVEASHAGDAQDAADELGDLLRKRSDIIQTVYQPGGGRFFARQGLLYLSTEDLWSLDERLAEAQPFLGTLARDPGIRGLLEMMSKAFTSDLSDGEKASFGRIMDRVSAAIEQQLAGKPQPIHWRDELFVNSDESEAKRSFLIVKPKVDYSSLQPAQAAMDLVRALARPLQERDGNRALRVRITGSIAMSSEELVTVSQDAALTTTLSFILVSVLLIWGLRSAGAVVAVLFTMTCGLIWTAAFAAFAVGALNLISVCFAVLFIGMGVDFGIQYAMRYLEELRKGLPKEEALRSAAAGAGGALALAAVGAAISFCAFVPTSYRGLAELGQISAVSMLVALVANLTLLPAIFSRLAAPRVTAINTGAAGAQGAFEAFVVRHRKAILVLVGVLTVGSIALLPHAQFDFNPLKLKDPTTESVATYIELSGDAKTSPYTIAVLAENLEVAQQTAGKLESLPLVDKAVTLASFVPEQQEEKLLIIDGMRTSVLPALTDPSPAPPAPSQHEVVERIQAFHAQLQDAIAAAAPASLLSSMQRLDDALKALQQTPGWAEEQIPVLQSSLTGDMAKTLQRLIDALGAEAVTLESLPQDLAQRYLAADGRARIEVYPKEDLNDNAKLREFVRSVQAVVPDATDSPVTLVEGSDTVIGACIQASILALVLTIILHILVLGSVVDALLIAAPLALAMLLTAATSVVVGIPFNFANIIALPLLIGLNNAYGAYFVVRRHGESDLGGVLASSTPRAVLMSGLTAIASFGVLAISQHPGMASMGVLITLSLLYALLSALIMLPAVMAVLDART